MTKYLLFGGGAGGGKSWLGCEWLITNCYFYPESRWHIGRNELKRLMSSSYITFMKVCKYHNIPDEDWKLNGQYNYIEFRNGSRIDLLDVKYQPKDPLFERFGSTEYTGGWLEEAGEIDFGAFDVLKSRIGRHMNREYNLPAKELITANPKKNWLYSTIYMPHRDGKLPKEYAFIQALYQDNPHTAESYGSELAEIKDESKRQRLMFGNWEYDDDPSALIEYDAIVELFGNKADEDAPEYLTIDVARLGNDKSVIFRWKGWQVKEIYVFAKEGLDLLEEHARSICNQYSIPRTHVIADEDGVGGGFVDHFKCKGFINNSSPIQPRSAEYDKTKKLNYANLKSQCYFMLADKINRREIGIDSETYRGFLTEELEQVKQAHPDKDQKLSVLPKDKIKENIGRSPDFSDAMMMRMWFDINRAAKSRGHNLSISYDENGRPVYGKKSFDFLDEATIIHNR